MRLLDPDLALGIAVALALGITAALYALKKVNLITQIIASVAIGGGFYGVTADRSLAVMVGVGTSILIYAAGWMQREHGRR